MQVHIKVLHTALKYEIDLIEFRRFDVTAPDAIEYTPW